MAKQEKNELINLKDSLNKLNKNETIAYFLGNENNPSNIKNFVSTGNDVLDLIISNRKNSGLPVGRLVEITGLEASGKSLVSSHILKNTQDANGIAVYIDTENSVSEDFLYAIGVDTDKLVYIPIETIEQIFDTIEHLIDQVRKNNSDKLLTIVVDSIAGATTEKEKDSDYNKDGWATAKAIVLSKAMRKITNKIGQQNVLLVFTNQLRVKLGCVNPDTTTVYIRKHDKKYNIFVKDVFNKVGYPYEIMEINKPIDISEFDYEILSKNGEWNKINQIIRKEDSIKYEIIYNHSKLETSGEHKILVKHNKTKEDFYIEVKDLINKCNDYKLNKNDIWYEFTINKTDEIIPIVDFNLEGNHTYLSNNVVSHNTMFGDPYTTSGGKAIGFHSSVRLRLKQMGQLKDKNKNVIGINIKSIVSKNRIGPPLRSCTFDILFHRGIDKYSGYYDILKQTGKITTAGAWSKLKEIDKKTGEIIEHKFYQKDFIKLILKDKPHLKKLCYNMIADELILKYERTKCDKPDDYIEDDYDFEETNLTD